MARALQGRALAESIGEQKEILEINPPAAVQIEARIGASKGFHEKGQIDEVYAAVVIEITFKLVSPCRDKRHPESEHQESGERSSQGRGIRHLGNL